MSPQGRLLMLLPAAYLLGCVPFGLLIGWTRGIDVRKVGSGNIGATNVGRLLGKRFFWIAFSLDMLKGLAPTLLASAVMRRISEPDRDATTYLLWIAVGVAAIVGHMFSVFLRFRGGKGVATSAGVMLGLAPYFTLPAVGAIAVFIVVLAITKYVSVGSIVAATSLPVFYVALGLAWGWPVFGKQLPLLIAAVIVAALVILRHRGNIARLRGDGEPGQFSR